MHIVHIGLYQGRITYYTHGIVETLQSLERVIFGDLGGI